MQSSSPLIACKWKEVSWECQWVYWCKLANSSFQCTAGDGIRPRCLVAQELVYTTDINIYVRHGRKIVIRRERYGGSVINSKYRSELPIKNIGLRLAIRKKRPPSLSGEISVFSQIPEGLIVIISEGAVDDIGDKFTFDLPHALVYACLTWLVSHPYGVPVFPSAFHGFPGDTFYFLESLFKALVIHGAHFLVEMHMDGAYLSNSLVSLFLKAAHLSSMEEAWYNWLYSSLKLQTCV